MNIKRVKERETHIYKGFLLECLLKGIKRSKLKSGPGKVTN